MSAHFDFMNGMMSLMKVVAAGAWIGGVATSPEPAYAESYSFPDVVQACSQEVRGSLVISHYADGAIRWENIHSGVIREEGGDGSLTVSLPDGKIIRQGFEGGPLQVIDLENPVPPVVAHIMNAHIAENPTPVYHYQDPQNGHYIIEVDTLRYFQVVDINFFRLVP